MNRYESERNARLRTGQDCTLNDIYQEMKSFPNLDDTMCDKLKALEVELELKLCVPREKMVEYLKYCREKGKKIILVSDMYLESKDIKKILRKCGIGDCYYDELYVSSEIKLRKDNGTVWKELKKKTESKKFYI